MNENFIVTVDRGHLRIYTEHQEPGQTPRLDVVEAMDFPQGKRSYTANDTDMAGRFQSSRHQSGAPGAPGGAMGGRSGMSIDERLPMKEEVEKRNVQVIAEELESFLRNRPNATWDFAAPPALHNAVIEALSPETRRRLRRALAKDLSNQSGEEVRSHFAMAAR
jgi:hypothetical protein